MKDLEDISLVTQAAVFHSERAFNKLVVKYQSQIRRFFLSQTLGDAPLSDDLAQDTFVKVYLNIGKFRGESSFSTWLYRIAYNVLYDYLKAHKLTESLDTPAVIRKHAEIQTASSRWISRMHWLSSPAMSGPASCYN